MNLSFFNKKYTKIAFLISALVLLFFSFLFFYNKRGQTLAQEQFVWDCGEEIPVGEAMDEALAMGNNIVINADEMLKRAGQQVRAVNDLYNLPLPDECQAGNCNAECNEVEVEVCPLLAPCFTITFCQAGGCTGNACPQNLMSQASTLVSQISSLYSLINDNKNTINGEVAKRTGIMNKLEVARVALSECATPAAGFVPEEQLQLIEGLVSCKEANFLKILPAGTNTCNPDRVDYNPDNFLCCRPRVP